MNPLYALRELFSRAFERKWTLVALGALFLAAAITGMAFVKTPVFYEYHLRVCDRFLDRVCYADRSVVIIFLERFSGNLFFLLLLLAGGIHPAALLLTTVSIAFRAYTFGGTLVILFSVYRASGALVAFALYLPIHLLLDAVFLTGGALSICRAFRFRFCLPDFSELLADLLLLAALVLAICLLEAVLLGALFHPIGNLT